MGREEMMFLDTSPVAFTGHRPSKLKCGYNTSGKEYDIIKQNIKRELNILKPEYCISGMALGIDSIAAEACIELDIPFIAAIPFEGQEKVWPKASQDRYHELLSKAESKHVVCEGGYVAWKLQKRNEWMVDKCNLLLAYWDGSNGGTANCVRYAESKNKLITIIDPNLIIEICL